MYQVDKKIKPQKTRKHEVFIKSSLARIEHSNFLKKSFSTMSRLTFDHIK